MAFILDILSQGWVGTVVGFVGILLAVVFYLRSRRKGRLAFQLDHVTLVGDPRAAFPDPIEIRFAGTVVPRVTASQLVIWNQGDRTISGTDLVKGDPLRVEVPEEGQILKHTILRRTRSVNAWKVDQSSPNRLELSFDFVDPGDGMRLEIIHSQPGKELDVVGTIKGIPKGLVDHGSPRWLGGGSLPLPVPLLLIRSTKFLLFFLLYGVGMIVFGLFQPQLDQLFGTRSSASDPTVLPMRWSFGVIGCLGAAFAGFTFWTRRRRYPASLGREQDDTNGKQDAEPGAA